MKTPKQIREEIAALEAQMAEAKRQERPKLPKALVRFHVKRKSSTVFYIYREIVNLGALEEKQKELLDIYGSADCLPAKNAGMSYCICIVPETGEKEIFGCGGGTVLLKHKGSWMSDGGWPITDEQIQYLISGKVPFELIEVHDWEVLADALV